MSSLKNLRKELRSLANSEKAKILQRFFKTGKGEYGEGDVFLGIVVPVQRTVAKKYLELSFEDLQKLMDSKIHEERLVALMILVLKYNKVDEVDKSKIFNFYLENTRNVNNWDLVDLSAPNIIGAYLIDKERDVLYKLAKSDDLWEKRISIVSTFSFIRKNEFNNTLEISEILLEDKHDLIHKAVGWMLREVGKRDVKVLESFLKKYYKKMPRTMLRYAIEKFPEKKRLEYLKGGI